MSSKSKTFTFTSRGKTFRNYWLAYSNKIGEVLNLVSDREIAHWVLNLEFNSNIKSFQFGNFSTELDKLGADAHLKYRVLVHDSNGFEYQRVTVAKTEKNTCLEKQIDSTLWRERHIRFRHLCDEDFIPAKQKIFPLLRLSGFLSACREQYMPPNLVESCNIYIRTFRHGTLLSYLGSMSAFDQTLCMLHIYRLYNQGVVDMQFDESPFRTSSTWRLVDE